MNVDKEKYGEFDENESTEDIRSSIEGLTVPQVRASLAALRNAWTNHSYITPLTTAYVLPCNMTAGYFSYHFIMGHHSKRQSRK